MARPELGNRHECPECDTKFYDFLRPNPSCPKCGYLVVSSDQPKKTKGRKARPAEPEIEATNEDETIDIDVDASGDFGEDDDEDDGVEEVNLSEENAEAMLGQLSSSEDGDDDVLSGGGGLDNIDSDDDFDSDVSYASDDEDESTEEDEEEEE